MVAFSLPSCRWRSLERMKCPSGVLGQFGQIQEWPNIDWTTNIDDWMVTGQARLPIPSHTLGRLSAMSACTDPCYIYVSLAAIALTEQAITVATAAAHWALQVSHRWKMSMGKFPPVHWSLGLYLFAPLATCENFDKLHVDLATLWDARVFFCRKKIVRKRTRFVVTNSREMTKVADSFSPSAIPGQTLQIWNFRKFFLWGCFDEFNRVHGYCDGAPETFFCTEIRRSWRMVW